MRLRRSGASSVRVFRHGLLMLRRILKLRLSWSLGEYESSQLRALADQQYWKDPIPCLDPSRYAESRTAGNDSPEARP